MAYRVSFLELSFTPVLELMTFYIEERKMGRKWPLRLRQKLSKFRIMIMFPSKTISWCSGPNPSWRLTYNSLQRFMDTQSVLLTPSKSQPFCYNLHLAVIISSPLSYTSKDAENRQKTWPQYHHPGPQRAKPAAVMLLQPLFPISAWQQGRL